jgi:hypothetical protein
MPPAGNLSVKSGTVSAVELLPNAGSTQLNWLESLLRAS